MTVAGKKRKDRAAEVEQLRKRVAELESRLAEPAEAARREGASESRLLAALMDSIPDNIYFKDAQSRFSLINRALSRLFKLKHPSEAVGKTDFDFFTGEHAAKAYEDEQKVIRSGLALAGQEEKETWPDGRETWVSTTKMPLRDAAGRVVGTFGISRDITARRRAESQLAESEARFRAVIQLAPDIIYRVDPEGRFVFVSDAVQAFGYTPDELLNKPMEALLHPDDAMRLRRNLVEHRVGGRASHDIEGRLCCKAKGRGHRKPKCVDVSISARGLWDVPDERISEQGKKFLGAEGIIHDITERKRVEEELQRHRAHLEDLVQERTASLGEANVRLQREIAERRRVEDELRRERDRARMYLDIAGTMIVVLDANGRVVLINRKGCEILGGSEREIVGKDWFSKFLPPGCAKTVRAAFGRLMAGKEDADRYFENEVRTLSGETRLMAWHNAVLRDESGAIIGALSSGEDITQRRRTEQVLLQSERLEAAGSLAEGVALSVSNFISVINDQAAFVAANTIPDTRPHEAATRILDATRRATELTKRLMGVAKASAAGSQVHREVVRLNDVVRQAVDLVAQPFAERKIRIVSRQPRLSSVGANLNELFDMLMVLLMNAADAMPEGGTLTLSAGVRAVPRPNPKLNPNARAGDFVVIRVRDTGVGISRENLTRIFEPFFTTKKPSESFGLGLPFVQSIVRRMGGWVTVHSREGEGTSFRLFIPKVDLPEAHDVASERVRLTHGRRVLLVDDQPELLSMMRDTLRRAGYRVCAAKDADTAIRMYRQHAGHVAVCVVDAVLPGSDQGALLKEITGLDAETGLILTSGFSREYVRSFVPLGAWGFLQKPFEADQFLEAVNEAVLRRAERERGSAVG